MACERRGNIYQICVRADRESAERRHCDANCNIHIKKPSTEVVPSRDKMRCGIRKGEVPENAPTAPDDRCDRNYENVFLLLAEGRRYLCGGCCR